jgi:hypothetical protein
MKKSGTSLLRKLVAQHPNVFGGLETHWFTPEMVDHWRNSSSDRQIWLRQFFDVSETEFAEIKDASDSAFDWFTRFMEFCAARSGKNRWVEKTPDNILHLDLIRAQWPDAQVLHVVRDYRDIYASWMRNDVGSLEEFVTKVRSVLESLGDQVGTRSSIYLEVPYENLVNEPRKTLPDVFQFLGETWDEELAEYEGDETDYRRVLEVTGKKSSTAVSLARPIFNSSVGSWKDVLPRAESQVIEKEFSRYFQLWHWA